MACQYKKLQITYWKIMTIVNDYALNILLLQSFCISESY
jgi:hypothetical protein